MNIEDPQWIVAVNRWVQRRETDLLLEQALLLEEYEVVYALVCRKLNIPVKPSERRIENPNPATVLYNICCTREFFWRNKHRFEWLRHAYAARNYGSEVYWQSFTPPPEVNADKEIRNRIKVVKRMITMCTNKIDGIEEYYSKQLFPIPENHHAYNRLKLKLEKYSNELNELQNDTNS